MPIKQSIESDLKAALLSGDKEKATTLRGLKSVILNAEITHGKRETGLEDDVVINLLAKEVKSRQESAALYERGGSPERADKELREKTIIESYLPSQLSDKELAAMVEQAIQETSAENLSQMSQVIALVRQKAKGQADGSRIAAMVKDKLS